jgi:hypothetical protein
MDVDVQTQKLELHNAIKLIQQFRASTIFTNEIKWELDSIEKFYKIKLQALEKVTKDAGVDKN